MRGSLKKRYKGSWSLILDLGHQIDPKTGRRKRRQKWVTFRGTKRQAEKKLNELISGADNNDFVEPSKLTTLEWLRTWLERSIKPRCRVRTYRVFKSIIEKHVAASALATIPLQKLDALHLEQYYASLKLSPKSIALQHGLLRSALQRAVKLRYVTRNVAKDEIERPRATARPVREQCWTLDEARRFLGAVRTRSTQTALLFTLALDTGARKGELFGLKWSDVDVEAATVVIARQLVYGVPAALTGAKSDEPVFGPTKNRSGTTRKVDLAPETLALLRQHKREQAELKMRNRRAYRDFDLVFAKEAADLQTPSAHLGDAMAVDRLARWEFKRLIREAGVPSITFHGMRHTCASLWLSSGESPHATAERLGHSQTSMTIDVYAHALKGAQQDGARRVGTALLG